MRYRPDIDGMRAIAVLGVLFYHAGLGFPGGYVGVDVFFVISGFLITTIILNELRDHRFSMTQFWGRRIRRILPAVSMVVLCIIIAGWFLMIPADYKRLGQQVLALLVLSANIKFWKENDYFDKAADTNPMLHTWSLSIEEQFYLFLPIVLYLLFKYGREKWIYSILWGTIILSFSASVYMSYEHAKTNFFLLPSRIWELDLGVLIAYRMPVLSRRSANIFSIAGLSGILIPYFAYPEGIAFPGMSALPPVLGSAMLIIAGTQQNSRIDTSKELFTPPLISSVLSIKPLVFIGLISYSLYLWHWPILAFQKYLSMDSSHTWIQLLLLACAFAAAWLSWRFVEQPFRKKANFPKTFHVYMAGVGMTILLLIPASYLVFSGGAIGRLDESMRNLYADNVVWRTADGSTGRKDSASAIISKREDGHSQIFVWGDSHAGAILPAIKTACKELGIDCQTSAKGAAPPVLDWYYEDEGGYYGNKSALEYNRNVFEKILDMHQKNPSLIVMLAARWELYFEGHKNGENVTRPGFEEAMEATIQKLRENKIKVIIFKQAAYFSFSPPDAYMRALFLGLSTSHLKSSLEEQRVIMSDPDRFFERIKADDLIFFDPNPILASENGDIYPVQKKEGMWYCTWQDNNHLSEYGSMRLLDELVRLLDTATTSH